MNGSIKLVLGIVNLFPPNCVLANILTGSEPVLMSVCFLGSVLNSAPIPAALLVVMIRSPPLCSANAPPRLSPIFVIGLFPNSFLTFATKFFES